MTLIRHGSTHWLRCDYAYCDKKSPQAITQSGARVRAVAAGWYLGLVHYCPRCRRKAGK